MQTFVNYIAKLDERIKEVVAEECLVLSEEGESELHLLFENRKHACAYMEHKKATV